MGDVLLLQSLQMMGMMLVIEMRTSQSQMDDVSSELFRRTAFLPLFRALISSALLMFRFCFPLGFLYFLWTGSCSPEPGSTSCGAVLGD
ncbi:hypothetical protein ASPBRDRAFT_47996 [Aspergillus brasiliensis CBS 101740]|uniref:Uncharacterized protein n=1 Tax=Aspergillus brasiliensis (strain CBS 101740 / IMI 381727 / IBT 21946) TaxID=767769 RepID=A0A1L9U700_ASPBC|nr:hypothetical protein ASPBRDRAFT_47996 [Aspergillus brasiliensis CBS 101740]